MCCREGDPETPEGSGRGSVPSPLGRTTFFFRVGEPGLGLNDTLDSVQGRGKTRNRGVETLLLSSLGFEKTLRIVSP